MKIKLITIVTILLMALPLFAQNADEIVRELESKELKGNIRSEGKMVIARKEGQSYRKTSISFISLANKDQETLIEFTNIEDAGKKILRTQNEIYLYFPDAEETIRLQGNALKQSVMGSDFSYEDMTESSSILDRYTASFLGKEKTEGVDCFKIKLTAKSRGETYPQQIIWINTENYFLKKIHFFTNSGSLLKEMIIHEYVVRDGKYMPKHAIITDKLKKGSYTESIIDKVEVDVKFSRDTFSIENLAW